MTRSHIGPLLAASTALTACSAGDVLRPDAAQPASVRLAARGPASLSSLGDTALVDARVLDAQGRTIDGARVRWSLSRGDVVQQDAAGVYRAVGNGRVTVVAQIDPGPTGVRPAGYYAAGASDSVVIAVRQVPARLALTPVDTAFTSLGGTRRLAARVSDARGNAMLDGPPALVWSSADPRVLGVDSAGVVRSLAEGTSVITVRAGALIGAATFTVQPRLPHTSCMVFATRGQSRQSCVTLDFVVRERGASQ